MTIVHISDTHNKHHMINLPEGDVLIHSGDFSHNDIQAIDFIGWMRLQPHKHKILVAGNHDRLVEKMGYDAFYSLCKDNDIIYLENTSVVINGIKFYGCPMSNQFGHWSFMGDDFELQEYWDMIEEDTDVLIVHGPAYKVLDRVNNNYSPDRHVGSTTLKQKLSELNVKYFLTGHIHEAYGTEVITAGDKKFTAINASLYEYNRDLKKPITFEMETSC